MKLPEDDNNAIKEIATTKTIIPCLRIANQSMNINLREMKNLLPKSFSQCRFDVGKVEFNAMFYLIQHKYLQDLSFFGSIKLEDISPAEMKKFFEALKKIPEVYIFSSLNGLNPTIKKFIKLGTDADFVVHYSMKHFCVYNY